MVFNSNCMYLLVFLFVCLFVLSLNNTHCVNILVILLLTQYCLVNIIIQICQVVTQIILHCLSDGKLCSTHCLQHYNSFGCNCVRLVRMWRKKLLQKHRFRA